MNITTFMNIIFCMIMLNLLLVGIASVLSIKALKRYQNYIDERELEEVMKEYLKSMEVEDDKSVRRNKRTKKTSKRD